MNGKMQKVLLAIVAAGSLGFGAAQAFAAPRPPTEVLACTNAACSGTCIQNGYYMGGRCVDGDCICYDDAR